MQTESKLSAGRIISAGVLLLCALYIGGYFLLGEFRSTAGYASREFKSETVAIAYVPLGWIEHKLRGGHFAFDLPADDPDDLPVARMLSFER